MKLESSATADFINFNLDNDDEQEVRNIWLNMYKLVSKLTEEKLKQKINFLTPIIDMCNQKLEPVPVQKPVAKKPPR